MIESKRQEMIELIRRMMSGEGDDDLYAEWIETLRRVTGNPHAGGIMAERAYDGMTPEAILDKLLEYRPFLMPPPEHRHD
jgi:hypothetical protein